MAEAADAVAATAAVGQSAAVALIPAVALMVAVAPMLAVAPMAAAVAQMAAARGTPVPLVDIVKFPAFSLPDLRRRWLLRHHLFLSTVLI